MKKKLLSIVIAVMMLFSFAMSSNAATNSYSSKSWNLYYTNVSTGSYAFDTFSMAATTVYHITFNPINSVNPGRGVKVTVKGVGRYESDKTITYTSTSLENSNRYIYFNNGYIRPVEVTLLFTTGGGVVGSTGSISTT